jgi:hypothetical protein
MANKGTQRLNSLRNDIIFEDAFFFLWWWFVLNVCYSDDCFVLIGSESFEAVCKESDLPSLVRRL